MAEYSLGASGGNFADYTARAQAAARAADELNQKERARGEAEERTGNVEKENTGVRRGVGEATNQLSAALQRNLNLLVSETEMVAANTKAWQANLAARVAAGATTVASSAAMAPVAPASASSFAARASQQEAAYVAESATLNAAAAQRAAQAVSGHVPLMLPRGPIYAGPIGSIGPAGAISEEQAAAAQRAAQAVSGRTPLMLPPGRPTIYAGPIGGTGPGGLAEQTGQAGPARYSAPVTMGGPSERLAASGPEEQGLRTLATRNAAAVGELGAVQRSTNLAFNESVAAYAASSQALSRHGALTTEFISAFSRGQVTLKEFNSQLVATMGKFGGWVVAGGAIYGAFDAAKHMISGATETQTGVQQVGRFIDLKGPGQQERAAQTFRDISLQFNVPIKDVVDSMQVMARVFHNISDAGDATRAVLAAVKLDMVPREQAEQFVAGIAQTMGWVVNGEGGGQKSIGLINSLNELQKTMGARVSQTLPAVARAAPAALAAGLDMPTLQALAALGVTSGQQGAQVGTTLLRSMGTFAWRQSSEQSFKRFGIEGQLGDYRGLIGQVTKVIDTRRYTDAQGHQQQLHPDDIRTLAIALGGPLQGTKGLLPSLFREYQHPGLLGQAREQAAHPDSFQQDLDRVLATTGERFHSLGIALEQFGSLLESSGVLSPLIAGFDVLTTVLHGIEAFVTPISKAVSAFNELPGVVKDAVGAFVAYRAVSALYNTQFGSSAQQFVGRLPGGAAIRSEPREAIRGTLNRMETFQLPAVRADEERLDRQYKDARQKQVNAVQRLAKLEEEGQASGVTNLPLADPRRAAFEESRAAALSDVASATTAADKAEQAALEGGQNVAKLQADIAVLKDRQYTTVQKTVYMEQEGLVALSATVNAQQAAMVAARAKMEGTAAMGAQTGRMVAAGSMEGGVASGAGVVGMAGMAMAGAKPAEGTATVLDTNMIATALEDPVVGAAAMRGVAGKGPAMRPAGETAGMEPTISPWRSMMLTGTTGMLAASQKISGAASSFAERAGTFLSGPGLAGRLGSSPGTAFAGMMGSQLLGSAIGGGVGGAISGLGGAGFTGMMMAQMLGGGARGAGIGLGLGLMAGGMQQGGTTGKVAGVAGGAMSGAMLGLMLSGGDPLGALAGGVIGGGVGFASSLLGGSDKPKDIPLSGAPDTTLDTVKQGGKVTQAQMEAYGQNFADTLKEAFTGTGTAATNAQNTISAQVTAMDATLKAFGFGSTAGTGALAALAQQAQQAAQQLATDPADAAKVVTATQTAMQDIATNAAQMIKVGSTPDLSKLDPTVAVNVARQPARYGSGIVTSQAGDAMKAVVRSFTASRDQVQHDLIVNQAALDEAQNQLAHVKPGDQWSSGKSNPGEIQARIDALKALVAKGKLSLQGLEAALPQIQQLSKELSSQLALTNLQAAQHATDTGLTLANVRTRNPLVQAQNTLRARITELQAARSARGLTGQDRKDAIAQQEQAVYEAQTAVANATTQHIQSTGAVAMAHISTGDPVGRARQNLQTLTAIYRALASNPAMRGSPELAAALAAMLEGQNALADATYQSAASLIQAEGQLAQAKAGGDAALQAAAAAQEGSRMLGIARTPTERASANAQIISAQTQAQDAAMQTAQIQGQIAEAQAYGDDVAVANAAIAAANAQLAAAHTTDQKLQAQLALIQANQQLEQARLGRLKEIADLQSSQTTDPVKQALYEMQGAAKILAQTPASETDLHMKAQTEFNQRRQAWEAAKIQSRQDDINFELQMQEITTQQAINQLTDLLHLKGLTKQQKHQIMEQIRQLQMSDSTGGQFDLAPGSIRLPTVYDVNRAIHNAMQTRLGAGAGGLGVAAHHAVSKLSTPHSPQGVHIDSRPVINVYVGRQQDLPGVADAIDRGIGSHLSARLRAAGIRGT